MRNYKVTVRVNAIEYMGDHVFLFPPRVNETIHVTINGSLTTLVVTDVVHFGADLLEDRPFVWVLSEVYDERRHERRNAEG
jgi:hypothetical protein